MEAGAGAAAARGKANDGRAKFGTDAAGNEGRLGVRKMGELKDRRGLSGKAGAGKGSTEGPGAAAARTKPPAQAGDEAAMSNAQRAALSVTGGIVAP